MVPERFPSAHMDRFVVFPGWDSFNVETKDLAGSVWAGRSLLDFDRGKDRYIGPDRYFLFSGEPVPLSPASLFIVMHCPHSFHCGRGIDYLG